MFKTYIKPSLLYACEAWRLTTKEEVEKLEGVQRRAVRTAGGLEGNSYKEACKRSGMSTIEDEVEEADMVRMYRIMSGHDKVEKTAEDG